MDALECQRVEQPDHVSGHVLQRVGRRGGVTGEAGGEVRLRRLDMGRLADVAIVETYDVAVLGERAAEAVGPAEHLTAEAHDQEHRWAARIAEGLVGKRHLPDVARLDHGLVAPDMGAHHPTPSRGRTSSDCAP